MRIEKKRDRIILKLNPLESLVSFKRKIEISISAIKSVECKDTRPGLAIRFPGIWIPGILRSGTYWRREKGKWIKEFWIRPLWGKPVTIELHGHEFKRIVIKTRNPERLKKELGS